MTESEAAAALRDAIHFYAQASVNHALSARAGLEELHGTEKQMLDAWAAVNAAIDATALTLAADMVEGLRQIKDMIDAPQFDEDRKCRIRSMASSLVGQAEALHMGRKSRDDAHDGLLGR
jgi:hypothetical protein